MVEAFLLNDDSEYLEIEISPRGRYLHLILRQEEPLDIIETDERFKLLPLFPDGVTGQQKKKILPLFQTWHANYSHLYP